MISFTRLFLHDKINLNLYDGGKKLKNIVEVKNLTKEYKQMKAVDDLSFEVEEGEIIGLLGPNGSR